MTRIAIDIGKRNSQVCIADDDGKVVLERRLKTERTTIAALFSTYAGCQVLLEAGTSTEWVAAELEKCGLVVIVADPGSLPLAALGSRNTKTDKRDARALVEALRIKAYRPAHRRGQRARDDVALHHSRQALVQQRTSMINLVKATLEQDGYRPPSSSSACFVNAVEEMELPAGYLERRGVKALLVVMETLQTQIEALTNEVEQRAAANDAARKLMRVPGVGPMTSLMFVSLIEDPKRFASAKQLRAYLGLVPREYSSGEKRSLGGISKTGDRTMRALLVQVAHVVRRSKNKELVHLVTWSNEVERRRGKGKAVVALARRLAGILWALWRDDAVFDGARHQKVEA